MVCAAGDADVGAQLRLTSGKSASSPRHRLPEKRLQLPLRISVSFCCFRTGLAETGSPYARREASFLRRTEIKLIVQNAWLAMR